MLLLGKGQFTGFSQQLCKAQPLGLLLSSQQEDLSVTKQVPGMRANSVERSWGSSLHGQETLSSICPATAAERGCSGLANSVWLQLSLTYLHLLQVKPWSLFLWLGGHFLCCLFFPFMSLQFDFI